jgi:GGDEF domain-containing protein
MYSHDGMKDSLTNLAAPPLLYEELRREIAKRKRSGTEIQILRLVLQKVGDEPVSESDSVGDLLELAQILASSTRGHDVCARMGEYEFLILFTGEEFSVPSFVVRLSGQWRLKHHRHILATSFVSSHASETGLAILNRLDLENLRN